jgi:hypothetical protein
VKAASQDVMINDQSVWQFLLEGVMWNSSAMIEANNGKDPKITAPFVTTGNVTEQGLF